MRILRKKGLKIKLKIDNPIPVKTRRKELIGDWLFISGYLIALFLLAMGFYNLVLGGIPAFTEAQSQLLAFSTSVLPLTIIFAWLDYRKGSFGKHWAGLQLVYKYRSFAHSFLRSAIKFFPCQLGHLETIRSALIKQMLCQFSCQLQQGFSSWSFCWWDCFARTNDIQLIYLLGHKFSSKIQNSSSSATRAVWSSIEFSISPTPVG